MTCCLRLSLVLLAVPCLWAAPPPGYYDAATGRTGPILRHALHRILTNAMVVPYSSTALDTSDALKVLDEDPANTNNVILIYERRSEPKTNFGLTTGWNREHLWPNSYGIDDRMPAYSDLHNLRAIDATVNSTRGNKYYDFSDTNSPGYRRPGSPEAPLTSADSDSWEPPDEVKGDVARALFYMDVRYEGDRTNEADLALTDLSSLITSADQHMGRLSTLLQWHRNDPVSAAEEHRNDLVFEKFQKNRNPFVDHPEWAEEIFGTNALRPKLLISRVADGVRITWAADFTNAVLEVRTNFTSAWNTEPGPTITTNGETGVFLSMTNSALFYRVRLP